MDTRHLGKKTVEQIHSKLKYDDHKFDHFLLVCVCVCEREREREKEEKENQANKIYFVREPIL